MTQQTMVHRSLPAAVVAHHSVGRVRLRISSRQGDVPYFEASSSALAEGISNVRISASPLTASLLIEGLGVDPEILNQFGQDKGLFRLQLKPVKYPLTNQVEKAVTMANRGIQELSKGKFDLPSTVFVGLLATGVYQILRGRFVAPPWYTAFWFALGLYSSNLKGKVPPPSPGE